MSNPTPKEVSESLTGFDEIAVKQKFGAPPTTLAQEDQTQFMRALVFVLRRRDGKTDPEAFHLAQTMTIGELAEAFSLEDAEADFVEPPLTMTP